MLQRIDALRQRDFMLIDTLNEHYAHFSTEMSDSYQSWRKFSYEETVALNEQNQKAPDRTGPGSRHRGRGDRGGGGRRSRGRSPWLPRS